MQFASYLRASGLVAIAFLAVPAGAAETADPAQLAMAATQEACEAFLAGDVAAAEKLLAPKFTLVSNAQVQSREEVLAEVRNRDPQYSVFRNHSMTAQVYGNAAIVQGITSVKGTSGDKSFEAELRFTDTLIKDKGQWRLVVSHATRIPAQ